MDHNVNNYYYILYIFSDKPAAQDPKQSVVCSVDELKEGSNTLVKEVKEEKVPEKLIAIKQKPSPVNSPDQPSDSLNVKTEGIIVNHITEEQNGNH